MNAIQLMKPNGKNVNLWMCGACDRIWLEEESYSSDMCCKCKECGATLENQLDKNAFLCQKCWGPYHAKIDADRLERAELIEDYDGPVCIGDKYWATADECWDDLGDDAPGFAHCCHVNYYQLNADDIIQNLLENAGVEDHDEHTLNGVKDLEGTIENFNRANGSGSGIEYWEEDTKKKCRVKQPDEESE